MNKEENKTILLKNHEKFMTMAKRLVGERCKENFSAELDQDLVTFLTTPASTRTDLVCAYSGGLIEHSLRVLSIMGKMRAIYDPEGKIPVHSIVLTALFHDIGKLGNGAKSYYLDNDSEWHREKLGQYYNINPILSHVPVSQLSLQFLIRNGFSLNSDEWYAISSIRDKNKEENSNANEPILAIMLQHAVRLACAMGKNKTVVTDMSV